MANPKRKAAQAKPITAHPLFPAVVALWFGALFGLGSLAVRPSLLESVVIASRIDLIVPAAAPPLGLTARILMALGMVAMGAVIGILIARQVTRPKTEVRQRKRTGVAREESPLQYRARDAHPDAPARRPISINDELGEDGAEFGTGVLSGRRRALAVELPEQDFVPHDMAPLPGGAPQIFDGAGLAPESDPAEAAALLVATAPLELGEFAQTIEQQTIEQPAMARQPMDRQPLAVPAEYQPPKFQPPTDPVTLDWAAAQRDSVAIPAPVAPLDMPTAMQERDVRQVFQTAGPAEPRQIFGVTAQDDHLPPEFIQSAGYKTSVFDAEAAQPLFPARDPAAVADSAQPEAPAFAGSPFDAPVSAAPEAALPPLGSLGMTDLAARLAESMRRRRAARDAALAAPPATSVSDPAEPVFEPAPYTPFAEYAPSEPIPAPFAVPVEAVAAAEPAAQVEPAVTIERLPEVAPAPLPMPAALRPLSFDDPHDDHDDDMLASLLPPRHIARPAPDVSAAHAISEPAEADIDEPVEEEKFGSLLDLGLGALVRPQFVRIEEPDADMADAEPVVIFPGQGAPVGAAPAFLAPAFAAAPAPQSAPADSAPFRRFDAPASVGHGQPIANLAAASTLDPAETDRALRAALANLQRMSGAA